MYVFVNNVECAHTSHVTSHMTSHVTSHVTAHVISHVIGYYSNKQERFGEVQLHPNFSLVKYLALDLIDD